jgi:hypothetical protein
VSGNAGRPTDAPDPAEAAAALRRVLAAVDAGDLDAASSQARALLRRMEGAVAALEAMDPKPGSGG